jgi:8-oxo-dGTP pyrophosphatase MutT (NUDIX family)
MNSRAQKMFSRTTADENTKIKVGVIIAIPNSKGELLMEKRSDCGLWGMPGGKIEPGESITEAAVREAYEETGLKVKVTRLLGVYSVPTDRIVVYPDNQDVVQLVDIFVETEIVSGELRISHESEELKFCSLNQLPTEIVPPLIKPLENYIKNACNIIA